MDLPRNPVLLNGSDNPMDLSSVQSMDALREQGEGAEKNDRQKLEICDSSL